MPDEDDGVSTALTAAIVAMKVRANVFEAALAKAVRDLRGQEEGIEIFVWMRRTYREELEKTLIAIEDDKPELAASLQEVMDEIEGNDGKKA